MNNGLTRAYTSIPATDDHAYWKLISSEEKTKVFAPVDKELHRQLLIKARQKKAPPKMASKEWKRTIYGQPVSK